MRCQNCGFQFNDIYVTYTELGLNLPANNQQTLDLYDLLTE